MRDVTLAAMLALALLVTGCTTTQKWAATGTVLGTAAGAIIGHQSGHRTEGAVIGAAVGGAAGGVAGHQKQKKTDQQDQ